MGNIICSFNCGKLFTLVLKRYHLAGKTLKKYRNNVLFQVPLRKNKSGKDFERLILDNVCKYKCHTLALLGNDLSNSLIVSVEHKPNKNIC
jgi:hypothetical protein